MDSMIPPSEDDEESTCAACGARLWIFRHVDGQWCPVLMNFCPLCGARQPIQTSWPPPATERRR